MPDRHGGMFTQEQQDYVAGVDDGVLRDVLLYQVRLRDLSRADYATLEKRCNTLTAQVIELKALLKQQEE